MNSAAPSFPRPSAAEYESRWRAVLAECQARGLDAVLAVSRGASSIDSYADVYYLAGHYGNIGFTPDFQDYWVGRSHSAVVLAPGREPCLIVDGTDYRRDLVSVQDVRFELDFPAAAARALHQAGAARGRVGVCGCNVMSARVFGLLRDALPSCELLDADDLIEALRVLKSPFELERVRAAAQVGDAVVSAIMERALTPGVSEAQAVAAGYEVGIGAGVAFFDTSIASGPYSNYFTYGHLPSWTQRQLRAGEIFHADSYGAVDGYLFDFGRTCIVGGSASADQALLAQSAVDAVEAGIAVVHAGARASEVFQAVHGHLVAIGLASDAGEGGGGTGGSAGAAVDIEHASALSIGFPPHGHGFGLGWEWPWVLPTEQRELAPGMCLAVEAMPTLAGVGSSYFEQDVIVTAEGCEVITGARKRWW